MSGQVEHETPEQWWERVSSEHGPAPKRVQDVWETAVRTTLAREQAATRSAS